MRRNRFNLSIGRPADNHSVCYGYYNARDNGNYAYDIPNVPFLYQIAKLIVKNETSDFIPVPEKIEAKKNAVVLLKKAVGDTAIITMRIAFPFQSMTCVNNSGKDIIFEDPVAFTDTEKLTSNINIYPLTNESVQIDLTFHSVCKKAKQVSVV